MIALTAAVRDLARSFPGRFEIAVDTAYPDVWRHNPHVQSRAFPGRMIDCARTALDRNGASGRHYLHSYLDLVNEELGTDAEISEIKGDIHLSPEELSWYSDIWNLCGREVPFWLICSGGKFDIPIKWWDHQRYQRVVDSLRGRIQFVQVGSWGNHHPPLDGAIDLRGKTSVRDLIHLVHHADGVLCGVTSLMHLAAAVPARNPERAAIIIAGNREPKSWEAYPGHIYLSSGSELECANCWNVTFESAPAARGGLCAHVQNHLPRCMDSITSDHVVEEILHLEQKGRVRFLSPGNHRFAAKAIANAAAAPHFDDHNITIANAPAMASQFLASLPVYPKRRFSGRGIVICAGGVGYFTRAWVCIHMLRRLGCTLPIELWHLGREELDAAMAALLAPLNVKCINAERVMARAPMRNPLGWELKCYAILQSRFREVLSLDADNVPIVNPEFLFDTPEYAASGAIFWPDYGSLGPRRKIWRLCGVRFRWEPEFESGQIVVNKETCWRAINLAWWYNDHSEFFYRYIHGDKDTFHMAWRRTETPYAMPPYPIESLKGVMCQHDFSGRRIFQHRNSHKWTYFGENRRIEGFRFEEDCRRLLDDLRQLWPGHLHNQRECRLQFDARFRVETVDREVFGSVVIYNEYSLPPSFQPHHAVLDVGAHIGSFVRACHERGSREIHAFEAHPENFQLAQRNVGHLPGVHLRHGAVLDLSGHVSTGPFPRSIGFENTGGAAVFPSAGPIPGHGINELLETVGYVHLLKLDCEGSEWPILFNLRDWRRIGAVCGEYHLQGRSSSTHLERLAALLKRHFPFVLVNSTAPHEGIGKFWASHIKTYFNHVHSPRNGRSARCFGKSL